MNKLYIYCAFLSGSESRDNNFIPPSSNKFTLENHFLCDIESDAQAMETAIFLNASFVRIYNTETQNNIWISNSSIIKEPDWYCPETIKNV